MKMYKCDKCAKIFNHKNHHSQHISRKTSCKKIINKPQFECIKCSKTFARKFTLDRHLMNFCKATDIMEDDKINQKCMKENDNLKKISKIYQSDKMTYFEFMEMFLKMLECDRTIHGTSYNKNFDRSKNPAENIIWFKRLPSVMNENTPDEDSDDSKSFYFDLVLKYGNIYNQYGNIYNNYRWMQRKR